MKSLSCKTCDHHIIGGRHSPDNNHVNPNSLTRLSARRVAILTGAGKKAFSAGMDLKERAQLHQITHADPQAIRRYHTYPQTGFAGLSRRVGRKPVIAAINGHAHGGGFELALNADIVLAARHATFRLPDGMRGTAAIQGALPRLVKIVGMQRASLVALTGYEVGAEEAQRWGIVAKVVDGEVADGAGVVGAAVEMGKLVASMSPDSVIVSRMGLREAWEIASVERAVQNTEQLWGEKLMSGENIQESLAAFAERRPARWKPSKL